LKYQRNQVRQEVIPILKKINPSLEETFKDTIEKIRSGENIYSKYIQEAKSRICRNKKTDLYVNINKLLECTEPLMVLYEIIKEFGFNYSECKDLLQSNETGKMIKSNSHIGVRNRDNFIISPQLNIQEKEYLITENITALKTSDRILSFNVLENDNFIISREEDVACIDYEKVKFPLKLRSWEEGDYFIPLGMSKKKKISDLLIDLKIPLTHKKRIKLLISEDSVVWVIGIRIDERFKITEKTRRILKIKTENL
jgi:tRNA(Ile)-lysidine synthase